MLANRLRHRIEIFEKAITQDSTTGAVEETWQYFMLDDGTVLDSVPAEVLTGQGKEFNQGGTIQGEVSARINLRWFPKLRQDMLIIWEDYYYNILSIETDLTGRQEYRLRCTAIAPSVDPATRLVLWNNIPITWDNCD